MEEVYYNENPTIGNIVVFDLETTNDSGTLTNAYKIAQIIIYFIDRSRRAVNPGTLQVEVQSQEQNNAFFAAVPVAIFGDDLNPAWLSTDPDNSFVTKIDYDSEGNPINGTYRLKWTPNLAREGDYVICYKWNILPAGDERHLGIPFYLLGDTAVTTAIPTHRTVPGKYETLMEKYLPQTYVTSLSDLDLTPTTIPPLNRAVAKGFTNLEDLANQIIDLFDANAVRDRLLPYLSNLFALKLRSSDTQLWRRQIKTAVPLFKKKGTLNGLKEALANAGITVVNYQQLWQVKSSSLFTDSFEFSDTNVFYLSHLAMLPIDPTNFELALRKTGESDFTVLSQDYVDFENIDGETLMTWVGENLSFNPIELESGDIIRILYQINPIMDQSAEDYIRTLPLFDQRDETTELVPPKNWNVKVIEENDPMMSLLCPSKHPFAEAVVWGQKRTEFAYSENAYNMDSYNGGIYDSTDPCDMDKNWQEPCSCCLSSKFIIDLEVLELSGDRMIEADEIIQEFTPFHAVPHQVGFIASTEDFVLPPAESMEILMFLTPSDNLINSQTEFNRIVVEGNSTSEQVLRNQLATEVTTYSGTGTGTNDRVSFYSTTSNFGYLAVDTNGDAVLDVLSGLDSGRYEVLPDGPFVRIVQGNPDSTGFPLDTSEVPYRLSNNLYSQSGASIYRDDEYAFSDSTLDTLLYPIESGWKIVVLSGPYAGTYIISGVNTDNSIALSSFISSSSVANLNYELKTATNVTVFSSVLGSVTVYNRGRVEMDLVAEELKIGVGDWVEYSGQQYLVLARLERDVSPTVDKLIIADYTGGDVVGVANIDIFRRIAEGTGFLAFQGTYITGTVPTIDNTIENNQFIENYAIIIGSDYYQLTAINGSVMTITGKPQDWGLVGTSVNYSIVQYQKTSPFTLPADGFVYPRIDRRGQDEIVIESETATPMWMMDSYNPNNSFVNDSMKNGESISIKFEYKK